MKPKSYTGHYLKDFRGRSGGYIQKPHEKTGNSVKDGLFKYHVKQFYESACSVASIVSVVNTLLDWEGWLNEIPVTQQDLHIPHISPVGGFDSVSETVTLLDVDSFQTCPYQVSFDTFYKGLSFNYNFLFRHFGYAEGGYIFIRI